MPATDTPGWGILGAGGISRRFAGDLANLGIGRLVAVGSTSPDHVADYAREVGAERGHGSYEALVADDEVDVVYVGNNHNDHARAAHLAIDAGKHLLIEKPLAVTKVEAAEVFVHAREAGVFCMEAMWSRFLPPLVALERRLTAGAIGTVRSGSLALGRSMTSDRPHRLLDPHRAGGALLDMGIYPISLAHLLLGPADEVVSAEADIEGGVDLTTRAVVRYGTATVELATSCSVDLDSSIVLEGDDGRVVVEDALHHPWGFSIERDGEVERVEVGFLGHGFEHEIMAVHEGIAAGWLEHPDWSHADTLATHGVLDAVRREIGLVYPFEDGPPAA